VKLRNKFTHLLYIYTTDFSAEQTVDSKNYDMFSIRIIEGKWEVG